METRDRPPPHKLKLWEHHGLLWEARWACKSSTGTRDVAVPAAGAGAPRLFPRGAAATGAAGTPVPLRSDRGTPAGPAVGHARQGMRRECHKSLFAAKVVILFFFFSPGHYIQIFEKIKIKKRKKIKKEKEEIVAVEGVYQSAGHACPLADARWE